MILNLWSPPKSPKVCLAIESSTSPWPTSWKSWVGLTIWNIACISTNHPYCMIAKHEKYLKPPTNATSYTLKDIVIMYIYMYRTIKQVKNLMCVCATNCLTHSLSLSVSVCPGPWSPSSTHTHGPCCSSNTTSKNIPCKPRRTWPQNMLALVVITNAQRCKDLQPETLHPISSGSMMAPLTGIFHQPSQQRTAPTPKNRRMIHELGDSYCI